MFRKILLPLDGSKLGEAVLPFAEELAIVAKAEVLLFQAIAPPHDIEVAEDYTPHLSQIVEEYVSHASAAVKDYLSDIKERLNKKGIVA